MLYNIVVVFLCILSYQEHIKSIRASSILNVYSKYTLIFDAVEIRSIWLIDNYTAIAGVFSTALALKLGNFLLEAGENISSFIIITKSMSLKRRAESLTGLYFGDLLARGRKKILELERSLSTK